MKHRKRSIRSIAFGAAFSLALAALAFFFATLIGDAEHEGTTGKGGTESLPMSVSFADGLSPENRVEVEVTLTNETGHTIELEQFSMDVETPTVPACGEEWLQFSPENLTGSPSTKWEERLNGENPSPWGSYGAGTQSVFDAPEAVMFLEFDPATEATDQSSCENVPVIVHAHAETP
jgi:hypothetical protein